VQQILDRGSGSDLCSRLITTAACAGDRSRQHGSGFAEDRSWQQLCRGSIAAEDFAEVGSWQSEARHIDGRGMANQWL